MGIFFVYILKSSVCLTIFYLFYKLLLSRDTFHRFNRIALLSLIMLSVIIPFCEITLEEATAIQRPVMDLENLLAAVSMRTSAESASQPVWLRVMVIAYIIGGILTLCQFAYSFYALFRLMRQGTPKLVDGIHLILMDQPVVPFSWMRTIVISRKDFEESGIEIMTHEMAHIKARHSIDLLISEICILFHWFNPSVWLLRQELQNIHEYEADESVLNQGVDAKRYQLLLIKKAVGAQRFTSMANSFNHSSLKKRIAMMLKQKSSPWARLKYLYVLPLAALTVVAFARPEISHELEKISSVKISEIIPVQEKKEPKRNVEVETLARDSVVFEKDMQAIQEKVSAVMEKYQPEIDKAVEEAVKAANIDEIVSAEMAKHQAEIDKATYEATLGFFDALLRLLHPFMPFITEELWQALEPRKEGESLMVAQMPEVAVADSAYLDAFEIVKEIVGGVRTIRLQKNIPNKDALELQIVGEHNEAFNAVIAKMCNLSSISKVEEKAAGAVSFLVRTTEYAVPLGNLINVEEELAKLQEELKYQKGFLASVMKKLGNENFVSKAPAKVIEMEKKKQADAESKIKSIEESIAALTK